MHELSFLCSYSKDLPKGLSIKHYFLSRFLILLFCSQSAILANFGFDAKVKIRNFESFSYFFLHYFLRRIMLSWYIFCLVQ